MIDRLPAWLSRHLPSLGGEASWGGGELPMPGNALYAWLTRYDPRSGRYLDTGLYWAETVDKHGCRFIAAQCGGTTRHQGAGVRGYEVGWFAFQAFPRRQKRFRLRLYDAQQKLLGEFVVPNPALTGETKWKTEPLPITKTDGDLSFTLASLALLSDSNGGKTNGDRLQPPPLITPVFENSEHGQPTKEWQAVQMELFDSAGNSPSHWPFKSPFLCPFERAWKLSAKFCGSENGPFATNASWTVGRLGVPQPGSFTALSATQQLQGVTLRLIGMAGAGRVTYSNEVPVHAEVLSGLEDKNYSESCFGSSGPGGMSQMVYDVRTPIPHIALLVSGLTEDERISIQATDDTGRNFYAKIWEWDLASDGFKASGGRYLRVPIYNSPHFLGLAVPDDAKELTLIFRVHRVRTVEFVLKPPGLSPQPN
ncbi:MAG: hypothetical protein DME19_09940 [Verrucomicrobia bacterium]|nr:MAG: hypothetical protein DME19_09940 [Verrucomicrobiota bacterium]